MISIDTRTPQTIRDMWCGYEDAIQQQQWKLINFVAQ